MTRRSTARNQRFAAACLAVAALAVVTHVSPAEGYAKHPVRSVAPATTASSSDLISDVCNLLKLPVAAGAKKLVSLFTTNRFAILSTALLAPVATKFICKPVTKKLKAVVNRIVAQRPALSSRVGPFVFNLYAAGSRWNAGYNHFVLHWREYDLTSRLRYHYAWYHFDSSTQWYHFPENGLIPKVAQGHTVQFALRIDNVGGISSPWVYSVRYNDY
jgi:hypothetical protein